MAWVIKHKSGTVLFRTDNIETARDRKRAGWRVEMDSRAQFEEWWETEWCGDAPMDGWQYLRGDDGYIDEGINAQWEAWQASRATMKDELPMQHEAKEE